MQDLERRIAELERALAEHERRSITSTRGEERGHRSAWLPCLALVGAVVLGTSMRQESAQVLPNLRTQRLEIVDPEGHARAELYVDEHGSGALRLFGQSTEGQRQAYATLSAVRGGGQLDLGSVTGNTTVSLGATGFGDTWGGFLRLISDDYPVVKLWTQNGTANLQMVDSDEEGGVLFGTRSLSSGRAGWLELRNGKGESALYLLSGERGGGVIELYDGNRQHTLQVPDEKDG